MVDIDVRTHRRIELAPIRFENRGATVEKEISILWVNDDWNVLAARGLHCGLDDLRNEYALVVIFQHERVGFSDGIANGEQHSVNVVALEIRVILLIDAHHLLRSSDDARFRRRRAIDRHERAKTRAHRAEHRANLSAAEIITDRRDEIAGRPDSANVLRNVPRAAECVSAIVNVDNGDGRFRRDPLDLAAQIDVEHCIADDSNPPRGRRVEQGD
jgi:hypothetical protein